MTIKSTRVTNPIIQNNGMLWLPDWCLDGLVNSHVPDEVDVMTEDSTQKYPIGTKAIKFDKTYRYSKAYAAMAAVGFLKYNHYICPGKAGNNVHSGYEAAMHAAVVAGQLYFDIHDTVAVKNEYEGSLAVWYDDTNVIYEDVKCIGNDVSNGVETRVYIAPPGFKVAHAAAVQVTIYRQPYVAITGTPTGYKSALGYAKFSITSGYWFWLQTAGPISGITGASTWPGQTQYYRDVYANTDGSLIGYTAGYQRIGYLLGGTASDYGDNYIMLQLEG